MKIKILKVYEKDGLLRVKTECEFGVDDIGMNLNKKKFNGISGVPEWQLEIKLLLEKKYKKRKPTKKKSLKQFKDQEIDLDNLK